MSNREKIRVYTASRIQHIFTDASDSSARATLARLRRGIGHIPGELPNLWGEFLLGLPEELQGKGSVISHAEWAIYTALTMFSLHQQGKSRAGEKMHREGGTLGSAVAHLVQNEKEDRERIARRFYPMATSTDMVELSHHLRGMVTLLRNAGIPLDYVRLAEDLYDFQDPERVNAVKLRWGEDFYQDTKEKSNEKGQENG